MSQRADAMGCWLKYQSFHTWGLEHLEIIAKYCNFEHLFDPCDHDLGQTIQIDTDGSNYTLSPQAMTVSGRSSNGKWVKIMQ